MPKAKSQSGIIIKQEVHPMKFSELMLAAEMVAKAGLFQGYDTPQKVATLMMLAQSEGRHPIEAMQRYDIIQGRPAKKPQAMLDDFIRSGGKVKWLETNPKIAKAEFTSPNGDMITMAFTWEQAQKANLTHKQVWNQYPENMLRARLISNAMRMIFPSATAGLYLPEEVESIKQDTKSPQEAPQEVKDEAELEGDPTANNQHVVDAEDHYFKPKNDKTLGESPKYMQGLHAIASDQGWTHKDLHDLAVSWGYKSLNDVPLSRYKEILDNVRAHFMGDTNE